MLYYLRIKTYWLLVLYVQTTLCEYVLMKQTHAKAPFCFHHTYSPHIVFSSRLTARGCIRFIFCYKTLKFINRKWGSGTVTARKIGLKSVLTMDIFSYFSYNKAQCKIAIHYIVQ